MADALDLGSSAARRGGSSPPSRNPSKRNRAAVEIVSGSRNIGGLVSGHFGAESIRYLWGNPMLCLVKCAKEMRTFVRT
jgi:hypothetical protein